MVFCAICLVLPTNAHMNGSEDLANFAVDIDQFDFDLIPPDRKDNCTQMWIAELCL